MNNIIISYKRKILYFNYKNYTVNKIKKALGYKNPLQIY